MGDHELYEELLYQYEILQARWIVREYYLKAAIREVYENIGQVLSVIRMQLSLLQADPTGDNRDKLEPSRQLIGQVIRDLRSMSRMFYPEENIVHCQDFYRLIGQEIQAQFPGASFVMEEKSLPALMGKEKKMIAMGIILEVLALIKEKQEGQLHTAAITCTVRDIHIILEHSGKAIQRSKGPKRSIRGDLSVFKRAELFGGRLTIRNRSFDCKRIILVIPIKQQYGKSKSGACR